MQSGRRREHATALISELLRTLSEDEPLLSEQERTRMADLCNIYSLNRSQTRQLLLQVKELRAREEEEEQQSSANRQLAKEVATQTDPIVENGQTSAVVIRKLLAQIQSAKKQAAQLGDRVDRLLKEKEEQQQFTKSLMEVNTVQTQVIAGLKDSIGKFTGMLKVKGDEKKPTTTGIKQNLENIAVEFKPQRKCGPVQQVNRNPLSEMIKPINTPQQIAKTEKDRLRDKILSRIKNRRTSHQSSTSTLPDQPSPVIPEPFDRMRHLYSVDMPVNETPHFRSSNSRKCSLGTIIDRLKTEPDRPTNTQQHRQNIFI